MGQHLQNSILFWGNEEKESKNFEIYRYLYTLVEGNAFLPGSTLFSTQN